MTKLVIASRYGIKTVVRLIILAGMAVGLVSSLSAATFSFPARHDHLRGSCRGTLVITDTEVRFEGSPHAAHWAYSNIQQLKLVENGKISVLTYQDSSKWRLGKDRVYDFDVEGGLKEAAAFLTAKLDQRLVIGVAQLPERVLAEFPVKHLRPIQGDEGTLIFGENTITYKSNEKGESRTWRYADIDDMAMSDPFHITINTYEQQAFHYATRRAFNFQLKEPIREQLYNDLWRRMNRPSELEVLSGIQRDAEVRGGAAAQLRKDLEAQADEAVRNSSDPANPQNQTPATVPPKSPPPSNKPAGETPRFELMRQILKQEGVPENLLAVAKVESGFNPFALSPKNARGIWQFIPETARRFGLRVDSRIDERTDPEKSTQAAARYLRELYSTFGDWKLALAGYNAGEKRVQSARMRAGNNDFSRLAPLLPQETRNYVPAVWAALGGGWQSAPDRGYRLFAPFALTGGN